MPNIGGNSKNRPDKLDAFSRSGEALTRALKYIQAAELRDFDAEAEALADNVEQAACEMASVNWASCRSALQARDTLRFWFF